MNVAELSASLLRELKRRKYFLHMELLEQTLSLIKVRLYISPELFVQIYRNDRYDTTNMLLVHGGQRLYGRDQIGGVWHRHAHIAPNVHDFSAEGQRVVGLNEFLNEVERVMAELNLP